MFFDVETYKALMYAAKILNYPLPTIEDKGSSIVVKVYDKDGWFADLIIESSPYHYGKSEKYDSRGIETELYKYISLYSRIDEIASIGAYYQNHRYSTIDTE